MLFQAKVALFVSVDLDFKSTAHSCMELFYVFYTRHQCSQPLKTEQKQEVKRSDDSDSCGHVS